MVESPKFSLRVRGMKEACMVVSVEGGKQVVREQVATGKFNPGEPSAIVEHT